MDEMEKFVVVAYVDGQRRMCRLTAELRDRSETDAGLRRIRVALTESELQQWASVQAAISDIVHHVHVFGDDCLFFDLAFPERKHGVSSVPYYRAFVPWFARKILARLIRRIWRRAPQDGTETRVELDEHRLQSWAKRYGTGSGSVHVVTNEVTNAYLSERLSEPETNLQVQLDHLKRVALNTTRTHLQRGTLELSKDRDGFYFRILNPRKQATLHGGVVDHGERGRPAWSVHT